MEEEILDASLHQQQHETNNNKSCATKSNNIKTTTTTTIQVNGVEQQQQQQNHQQTHSNTNNSIRPSTLFDVNGKSIPPHRHHHSATTSPIKFRRNHSLISANTNGGHLMMNYLNNINSSSHNDSRRQSLPVDGNLNIPHSLMLSSSFTQGYDIVTNCPASPQRRGNSFTPLMTPAISISSLVSSLEGSMNELNIAGDGDDEVSFDGAKFHGARPSHLNNPEQFAILLEQDQDIIDSRLQRFFDTLDNTQYIEDHQGKDFQPDRLMNRSGSASLNDLSDANCKTPQG